MSKCDKCIDVDRLESAWLENWNFEARDKLLAFHFAGLEHSNMFGMTVKRICFLFD